MTDNAITARLREAADGLLWLSESESPFEVVRWDGQSITPAKLLQLAGYPAKAPIEVHSVDDFFAPATAEQDWYGDEEKATAQRYRELVDCLKANLSDIKVYRVGQPPEIHIYIIGVTRDGKLVGISTQSIET